jgi:hypothetical protein
MHLVTDQMLSALSRPGQCEPTRTKERETEPQNAQLLSRVAQSHDPRQSRCLSVSLLARARRYCIGKRGQLTSS